MTNGINVFVWGTMYALLLPVYGLFVFKVFPHILVTGNKVSLAIVNVFFVVMGISLVIAMGGWELNMHTGVVLYVILPLFFLLTVAATIEIRFLSSQQEQLQQIDIEREQAMRRTVSMSIVEKIPLRDTVPGKLHRSSTDSTDRPG